MAFACGPPGNLFDMRTTKRTFETQLPGLREKAHSVTEITLRPNGLFVFTWGRHFSQNINICPARM